MVILLRMSSIEAPLVAADPEQQLQTVSLFDQYREEEVTIRGVTGKLGSLIALCPVPREEMSPEAEHGWTRNVLVEAGKIDEKDCPAELADYVKKNYQGPRPLPILSPQN